MQVLYRLSHPSSLHCFCASLPTSGHTNFLGVPQAKQAAPGSRPLPQISRPVPHGTESSFWSCVSVLRGHPISPLEPCLSKTPTVPLFSFILLPSYFSPSQSPQCKVLVFYLLVLGDSTGGSSSVHFSLSVTLAPEAKLGSRSAQIDICE